ncbi:MAG: response regulator [Spirochaetales bacterium]|nr:response regulator [Spirochaetales bacterium]
MKKVNLFFLIIFCALLFLPPGFSDPNPKLIQTLVRAGIGDLATREMGTDGLIRLNGAEFGSPEFDDSGWNGIKIPSFWNDHGYEACGYGGPWFAPVIGSYQKPDFQARLQNVFEGFMLGIFLMICVFCLVIWLMKKKEPAGLFCFLSCLAIALRALMDNSFMEPVFIDYNIFDITYRIGAGTVPLAFLFYFCFMDRLYRGRLNKKVLTCFIILSLGLFLLWVFVPPWYLPSPAVRFDFVAVVFGLAAVLILVFLHVRKAGEAGILVCGVLIMGLSVALEAVHDNTPAFTGILNIQLGFLCFTILNMVIVARRFSKVFRNTGRPAVRLQEEGMAGTVKLKEQMSALESDIREKTDFFIILAHEVRTPLTLMTHALKRFKDRHGGNPELDMLGKNFDKLKRDIINTLDFEKLNRNQLAYNHNQLVSFSALLQEKVALFRDYARTKKIKLNHEISRDVPVLADPFALDRIINNLIDNAIRYTPEYGMIDVVLKTDNSNIYFTVVDTGIGIPEERRARIFKPYYQLSHRKVNIEGIGMGLSIVKKIMDNIGGTIQCYSKPGIGTRFELSFPIRETGEKIPVSEEAPHFSKSIDFPTPSLPPATHLVDPAKDLIFIVEDNWSMVSYLYSQLADRYNVAYALSGKEGLSRLDGLPAPSLIITDIIMDELDGIEFIEHLSASEKYRAVPIIVLTAKAEQGEKLRALSLGAIGVICKPFSLEELKVQIAAVLNQQRKKEEAVMGSMKSRLRTLFHRNDDKLHYIDRQEKYNQFGITSREKEITELLIQGLKYQEVSDNLSISINTLRPYIRKIYEKCNVQNKVELINLFTGV